MGTLEYPLAWSAFAVHAAICLTHAALTARFTRGSLWLFIPSATALLEAVGYLFRVIAARYHDVLWPAIATSVLLLVPPALLTITHVELLGTLVRALPGDARVCRLSSRSLTRAGVTLALVCVIVLCVGPLLILTGNDVAKIKQSSDVILGGMCLQVAALFFIAAAAVVVARHPKLSSPAAPRGVSRSLTLCLFTITLLLVRSGYRVYDLVVPYVSPGALLQRDERIFYGLECAPVVLAHLFACVGNAGWLLPIDEALARLLK